MIAPETVADHDCGLSSTDVVGGIEEFSERRADAEGGEVIGSHEMSPCALRLLVQRHVERDWRDVDGRGGEEVGMLAETPIGGIRDRKLRRHELLRAGDLRNLAQ